MDSRSVLKQCATHTHNLPTSARRVCMRLAPQRAIGSRGQTALCQQPAGHDDNAMRQCVHHVMQSVLTKRRGPLSEDMLRRASRTARSLLHDEGLGPAGQDALLLQLLSLARQHVLVVLHDELSATSDAYGLQGLRLVLGDILIAALKLQQDVVRPARLLVLRLGFLQELSNRGRCSRIDLVAAAGGLDKDWRHCRAGFGAKRASEAGYGPPR